MVVDRYKIKFLGFERYDVRKTDIVRLRNVFAWIPLRLNKFRWLKTVEIQERLYFVQKRLFDDATWRFYWTRPYEKWKAEKIA